MAIRRGVRWARKRLDLSPVDVARGLRWCLRPPRRDRVVAEVAASWPEPDHVVATLSVRSGFDLLLGAVDWPPGSEIVFSAVTVPHMAVLARAHGYVPVAIDLDPLTMRLEPEDVRAGCTERTRAVVVAQLFGACHDIGALAEVTRALDLMLIADCAQCYDGRPRGLGDADVALYSFGSIKTATCVGGGIVLIGDPGLRERMRAEQDGWPCQSALDYAAKLVKTAALIALATPTAYGAFTALLTALGRDYDAVIRTVSRGFDDRDLLRSIRRRPGPALLALLAHRLRSYDAAQVDQRTRAGCLLARRLDPSVRHLGGRAEHHTHWLFPIAAHDPPRLIAAGRAVGFDLTAASSTLVALGDDASRAGAAMRSVVYLPVYAALPDGALDQLAALVNADSRLT